MKYANRPLILKRYSNPLEVEPIRVISYSAYEADLTFTFEQNGEDRRITLYLNKEEAQDLIEGLQNFISDK